MRLRIVLALAIAPSLAGAASASPAPSLPDNVPAAFAKEKGKWKRGGCEYKYKADRKGYKEEYKCK